jgi:hypothetical protein
VLTTLRARLTVCGYLVALLIAGCRDDDAAIQVEGVMQVSKSLDGVVTAKVGETRTIRITFSAGEASPLSALAVGNMPQSLLAGWSGPAGFSCPSVTSGSDCVLNLTYTPTVAGIGTLALGYSYRTSSDTARTGTVFVDYRSTVANSVAAVVGPSAQIKTLAGGGSQTVAVTFNSDDGNPATALAVTTDLTTLPAGWTSASAGFNCDDVNAGNGCQLLLIYAPASVGSGTLVLEYRYDDNSNVAKTGSVSIDYAATSHNNLTGTVAPSGQVNATVGAGSRNVAVTFTTDDGHSASNIALTTSLTSLPPGWTSAAPSFGCANASIGNGCQLALTYTPLAVGSSALTLQYTFDDNSGTAQSGSVDIPYAATSDNSVVGTASPAGQITVVTGGSQAVTVTFTTDDGNPASALSMTTDLGALPTGWSSSSPTFNCASVAFGNGCQLALTYEPLAASSGTLTLNYAYTNHSGAARTGSVAIPYQATSEHVYAGELFDTMNYCDINSDGTLSNCAATSGLSSTGAIAFKGSRAYVAELFNGAVHVCSVAADGSLSGCVDSGGVTFFFPFAMTISGNFLYVANAQPPHTITYCTIESSGSLTSCAETTTLESAEGIAFADGYVYISQPHSNAVNVCQQNSDGSLSNCATTGSGFAAPQDLVISGGYAYVTNTDADNVSTCVVSAVDGTLSSCTTSPVIGQPMGIALRGSQAYVSTRAHGINLCDVSGTGTLSNCVLSNGGMTFSLLVQVAVH